MIYPVPLSKHVCAACEKQMDVEAYGVKTKYSHFYLCEECRQKYITDPTFRLLASMRAQILTDIQFYEDKCNLEWERIKALNAEVDDPETPEYFRNQKKAILAGKWQTIMKYRSIQTSLYAVVGGKTAQEVFDDIEEVDEEDD